MKLCDASIKIIVKSSPNKIWTQPLSHNGFEHKLVSPFESNSSIMIDRKNGRN